MRVLQFFLVVSSLLALTQTSASALSSSEPPQFEFVKNNQTGSLERIKVTAAKTSLEILTYGAHIISWVVKDTEQLYLSPLSKLDGSKPIRGGIPVVFPQFARPKPNSTLPLTYPKMPMHGFARSSNWTLLKSDWSTKSSTVTLILSLTEKDLTKDIQAFWDIPFEAQYKVQLNTRKLTLKTSFSVQNLSDKKDLVCDILFHTYLSTPNLESSGVKGLLHLPYIDKNDNFTLKVETQALKIIRNATDNVYKPKTDSQIPNKIRVPFKLFRGASTKKSQRWLTLITKNIQNVVLWNPHQRKTDDLPEGDYKKFVCIEPGVIGSVFPEAGEPLRLKPNQVKTVSQKLSLSS